MGLSLVARKFVPIVGGLVTASVLAVAGIQTAAAQGPRIPPGSKGYQTALITQRHLQSKASAQAATRSYVARTASAPGKQYLTIRGPQGDVRTFELQGEITRVYRSGSTGPNIVTLRGTDGRTRAFVLEGEVTQVEPAK